MNDLRDRLPSADVDQLALAIASEARRLRLMLVPQAKQRARLRSGGSDPSGDHHDRLVGGGGSRPYADRDVGARLPRRCRPGRVRAARQCPRPRAPRSAVDIRATDRGGITTLYIEDRGPGIKGTNGKAMFKRGRRGAHSPGSGLGLHIARRLMVDQGGSLTVFPRLGGGASFMLTLPSSPSLARTSASGCPTAGDRSAGGPSAGGRSMSRRVLVVEDQVLDGNGVAAGVVRALLGGGDDQRADAQIM